MPALSKVSQWFSYIEWICFVHSADDIRRRSPSVRVDKVPLPFHLPAQNLASESREPSPIPMSLVPASTPRRNWSISMFEFFLLSCERKFRVWKKDSHKKSDHNNLPFFSSENGGGLHTLGKYLGFLVHYIYSDSRNRRRHLILRSVRSLHSKKGKEEDAIIEALGWVSLTVTRIESPRRVTASQLRYARLASLFENGVK